jgi:hypothetical protein
MRQNSPSSKIRINRINVKPLAQKYSAGHVGQITGITPPGPRRQEGTLRDRHGTLARVAMDAFVQVRASVQTTGRGRTAKSCGPDAAMLASSRQQSLLPVTVTTSPLTGESAI